MKKKKILIITGALLIVAVIITAIIIFVKKDKKIDSDEVVYVESVANLMGLGISGENRYMGVVETQETSGVDKADDRTVKEIFVSEGDSVKKGDKLFEYDTDEMNLKLKQLELELTSIYNNITTLNSQIKTLSDEKNTVEDDYKIEYTSQIQSLQAQINQENYNASAKELEIDRQKKAIENAIVFSPMDGVIKSINNNDSSSDSEYGSDSENQHFITIMDMGEYRVKASLSEFDMGSFMTGDAVIIRSRVDDSKIWKGTVTKIDTDNPEQNNNYYYYDMGTTATKYPMYVSLDDSGGIMLGQHVYVEMDFGQTETREGIWLDEFYIMQENNNSYVWVEKNGKIEKRKIELGDYDADMWKYEIVSGITENDYIAYPEDRIKEGMRTTHNYEDVMTDDMYNEDMMPEDDYIYDEDMMPEDAYDYEYDEDMMPEDDYVTDEYIDTEEAY